MNSPWIHERPARRPARVERPAQLELTLELPRDREPIRPKPSDDDDSTRGVAIIDFYV